MVDLKKRYASTFCGKTLREAFQMLYLTFLTLYDIARFIYYIMMLREKSPIRRKIHSNAKNARFFYSYRVLCNKSRVCESSKIAICFLSEMSDWILYVNHPLVLAGLCLLLFSFIIRFGRGRWFGKSWLLISGREILPFIGLLAVAVGLVLGRNNLAIRLNSEAVFFYQKGDYENAERLYKRAVEMSESEYGKDSVNVAAVLNNLAELYKIQKRYAESEEMLDKVFFISGKYLNESDEEYLDIITRLAYICHNQGKLEKSIHFYVKEIDIRKRFYQDDIYNLATAMNNLAGIYLVQQRYDDAEQLYQHCVDVTEKKYGKDSYELVDFLDGIMQLFELKKEFENAAAACERSLAIYRANLPDGHQLIKNAQDNCNRVKLKL